MFRLSQVLSNSHKDALQAWGKGAPKAESIAQARQEWAPHLATWSRYIQSNFMEATGFRVGRERLGWVDDEAFWKSFWLSLQNVQLPQGGAVMREMKLRLSPYIEGAACAGSLSFFKSMPRELVNGLLDTVLEQTPSVIEPCIVAWLRDQDFPMAGTWANQSMLLREIQWRRYQRAPLEIGRGNLGVEESVDFMSRLVRAYLQPQALQGNRCMDVFGHLFAMQPEHVERKRIVERLQTFWGEEKPLGLDLRLMSVCSGYPLDDSDASQAIARLGKHLTYRTALGGGTRGPGSDILLMLQSLESIESPEELYGACQRLGLDQCRVVEHIDVDGSVFSAHEGASP